MNSCWDRHAYNRATRSHRPAKRPERLGAGDDHISVDHDLTTATAPSGISAGCPVGLLIAVFITAAGFLLLTRSRG